MELEELAAEIPHRLWVSFPPTMSRSLHKDLPSFLLSVRQCGPILSPTKFELAIGGSEGSSPIITASPVQTRTLQQKWRCTSSTSDPPGS
jgi:hypothetical protein